MLTIDGTYCIRLLVRLLQTPEHNKVRRVDEANKSAQMSPTKLRAHPAVSSS